ncbi:MAG: hypothetical protein KDA81_04045, partial [Planctomycetaceae bacterium]|nr:hypothetical protein [Planctomycetaceae bacterium]
LMNTVQGRAVVLVLAMVLNGYSLSLCDERTSLSAAPPQQPSSPALNAFLKRFDEVSQQGFVKTLRSGSTGVGYTLETLLGIPENNSSRGDFMGMEIKAYRDAETEFDDHEKMNLFLKEPTWTDGRRSVDRIRDYGYVDSNGRNAWYQSVTFNENQSGLRLSVDHSTQRVTLLRNGRPIGDWTFAVLEGRLQEKHSETVFVAARTRGTGADEQFHFRTVTYCAKPSVERLVNLIEAGDVILELRMHIKPTGGARNHGTAFRVRKHRLVDLYAVQHRCRPAEDTNKGASSSNQK